VQALGGACSSVRPARPSWTSHRAPDAVVAARQHRRIHSIIQHLASATYHVNAPSVEIRMPTPGLCASGPLPPHTLSSRGNVPWSAFLPMSGVFASLTVLAAILAQYMLPHFAILSILTFVDVKTSQIFLYPLGPRLNPLEHVGKLILEGISFALHSFLIKPIHTQLSSAASRRGASSSSIWVILYYSKS
jgi:hypothetical protein